jgi:O-methyltransferase involved in polyketide biosynthesis
MADQKTIELGDVQETLLLPMWGRAVETEKKKPLLIDKTAVEIVAKINYDFSTIANNISFLSQFAWIARSLHIDQVIKRFLKKHPQATIVNIGCGLDTTFDRVDNGSLYWYDLDLPDVIKLRRDFIKENERRKFIAGSFLDDTWFKQLKIEDNVLFIAAGVFYYFEADQMKDFFIKLADLFPGSEIIFDAASPLGIKVANKKVIKDGGMDQSAVLKWGFKNAKDIQAWDSRIKIVAEHPMFKNMKHSLIFKEKIGTFMSDFLKIMSMVHLRFEK